jgi:Protein of unknown function (DUF4232)
MDPSRPDRILQDWDEVASQARRPVAPPRAVVVRSGLSGTNLAGALVLVAALLLAVVWFGRPASDDQTGGILVPPSATPVVTPPASDGPTPQPTPSATPSATPTPSQEPSATPRIDWCAPADLAARITLWEGAAGSRIAHVELTNAGSQDCALRTTMKPQLVDGRGSVLIDGAEPSTSAQMTFAPGAAVTTLVQASNYCGPAPAAPVSVAFVVPEGRTVATPASPTDMTLPPCNGAPDSPGAIEMHPWAT